ERSVDPAHRSTHAVADDGDLRSTRKAEDASHGAIEPRDDVIPGYVPVLVLRDPPVETICLPRSLRAEGSGEARTFPQIDDVPAIDHRGHEENRNVRARGGGPTKAIDARLSVAKDGVLGCGCGAGLVEHAFLRR